jgi:hypothetical protein|tara:strand:+ start:136 stop:603 length:468 start_codon:yes stop_codon:yes gene_type:complete
MSICKENAKQIRKIETTVTKYIFNSYIKGKNIIINGDEKQLTSKEFMDKIFLKSNGLITQDELLKEEIDNISKADEDYLLNLDKYKKTHKTVYGYPNEFRCHHIIYKKNKFIRCSNKIDEENGGDMFCIQHWDSINPYEDEYNKLVNTLKLHSIQ